MENTFIEKRKITNIFQMYRDRDSSFKETIGKLTEYKHTENMFSEMRIKRYRKPNIANYIFAKSVYYNRFNKYPTILKFANRGYLYDKVQFIDKYYGLEHMPYLKSVFSVYGESLMNYNIKEQIAHLNEDIHFTRKGFMQPYMDFNTVPVDSRRFPYVV